MMTRKTIDLLLVTFFIGILSFTVFAAPPANDNFNQAVIFGDQTTPYGLFVSQSNAEATTETGEASHGGVPPSRTIWFKWTAPSSKGVRVATRRSNFDTALAVYTINQFGNLVMIGENNNISSSNNRSTVTFFGEATKVYYIAVGNGPTSTAGGTVELFLGTAITRTTVDFDGDGATDIGVYRPSDNTYYIYNSAEGTFSSYKWGSPEDIAVPGNITQNNKPQQSDFTVFRPSTGDWHMRSTDGAGVFMNSVHFGQAGDIPMIGNFGGSVDPDVTVYRPSEGIWYTQAFSGQYTGIRYGLPGDVPVPGEFDNDGLTDMAVFRPSNGTWYITQNVAPSYQVQWGQAGDIPLRGGDYDGDGITDVAVFRPSTGGWYIRRSRNGAFQPMDWGQMGDIPVVGDYNADGYFDYAVFRPSTGDWHIRFNGLAQPDRFFHWGLNGDVPLGGMTLQ